MNKDFKSYCSRCGKERVISKEWKEKVGMSIVEITERSCPDKKCQKIIDKELARAKKKRLDAEEKRKNNIRNKKKVIKKARR